MSRADIEKIVDAAILWVFCPTAGGYRDGPAIEDTCEALGEAVRNYLGVDIDTPPDEWWSVEEMRAAIAEGVESAPSATGSSHSTHCGKCQGCQDEIDALRSRIAELEAALAAAESDYRIADETGFRNQEALKGLVAEQAGEIERLRERVKELGQKRSNK